MKKEIVDFLEFLQKTLKNVSKYNTYLYLTSDFIIFKETLENSCNIDFEKLNFQEKNEIKSFFMKYKNKILIKSFLLNGDLQKKLANYLSLQGEIETDKNYDYYEYIVNNFLKNYAIEKI